MNNQSENRMEIEEMLRKSPNHTINDILAELNAKRNSITRLLKNGWPIFESAPYERCEKLYHKRRSLWIKVQAIDMCASIVIKYLQ